MRGLAELRDINENPSAARKDDALFERNRNRERDLEQQRRHGQRVEARQAQNRDNRPSAAAKAAVGDLLAGLLIGAAIEDMLGSIAQDPPSHQDRIQPGIDQPPFIEFWADLNKQREWDGKPEALYKEARSLFNGGETPIGAMTFIGKQWDGLRAVPSKPVTYLGGERPAYHGEYREVTRLGVKWHKVLTINGDPVSYQIPEAAVNAAEYQRNKYVAPGNR